jgi:hypothetical protein
MDESERTDVGDADDRADEEEASADARSAPAALPHS